MGAVVTSDWQHANFEEMPSATERLSKLAQHITEVRKAAVEQGHGAGRLQRLPPQYLQGLEKQIGELRLAIAVSGGPPSVTTVMRPQI